MHASELREFNIKRVCDRIDQRLDRLMSLCRHFDIDPSKPGWKRNLVLSLVLQHQPSRVIGGRVSVGEIFAEFGIDPDENNADFALALRLANQHVPGFRLKLMARPFGRLAGKDFLLLAHASEVIREHFREKGEMTSDRKVASAIRNLNQLKTIVPINRVADIIRIVRGSGNSSRGACRSMSDRKIREYLRIVKLARGAYEAGTPTRIQREIIEHIFTKSRRVRTLGRMRPL